MDRKKIAIYAMCLVLSFMLPLAACAQEHRHGHSRHGEILVTNDTDTQISYFLLTEKFGRKSYTAPPGYNKYPAAENSVRIRVTGDDQIEIADWGTAYIEDVAEFRDGKWNLSFRHARRVMHRR